MILRVQVAVKHWILRKQIQNIQITKTTRPQHETT